LKHLYIPLILFLLIVVEGIGINIFPAVFWDPHAVYIPHFAFVFLMLIAIFYDEENTYISIVYALITGLLIDIAYTDILGVYMFSYTIAIYIVYLLSKVFQGNFYITLLIGMMGIIFTDTLIHLIYYTIDKTFLIWDEYLLLRLIPTIIVNVIVLASMYPIFEKRLTQWKRPS